MKKKILAISVVALCAAVLGYATLAYFTTQAIAHNVITTGGIDVEIVEKQADGTPFPEEGVSGIVPGTEVSKIVTVKNREKSSESWVRVGVAVKITDGNGTLLNPAGNALPTIITGTSGEKIDVVTLDINTTDWIEGEDGYYYYRTSMAPGEVTTPLFQTVGFAPEMGNEYQGCRVMIDIDAQAVQTANNPIPDGGDVTGVKGWPET